MNNVFSLQKTFEGRVFQIPDYQRGYAWEEQHCLDLWEDIEFLASGKKHYTGNLVLEKKGSDTVQAEDGSRHEIFDIVDGQQRLTTLVILLDCLRPWFKKDQPSIAQGLLSSYIRFTDRNGQAAHRLRLNSDSHEFFARNIIGDSKSPQGATTASHERLKFARDFFTRQIEKKSKDLGKNFINWRDEFLDRITQRLQLGHYLVDDSSEVGIIFEVMNNRGKPLSELEKVKNYLLYLASKLNIQGHGLTKTVNEAWADIFIRLMAAGIGASDYEDRLLRAHWLLAYDPDRRNWMGSKSIKQRFHLRIEEGKHKHLLGELTQYIASLRDSAVAFCDCFSPARSDTFGSFDDAARTEIRAWMEKIARNGVRSPFLPLLMAARQKLAGDSHEYLRLVKVLELYEFRVFRWEGKRANAGETRLLRLGYELYHGTAKLEDICQEITSRAHAYLSNKDFADGFTPAADNNFYYWPGIRYFLYEYELHLAAHRKVRLRWDELQSLDPQRTIEHILPQTPTNAYWKKRFTKEQCEQYTHALGNLSLTLDNSAYGNKPFPDKCGDATTKNPCYATSSLFIERAIAANYSDWTPADIESRNDALKKWALKRWHIETSAVENIPLDQELKDEEDTE